MANKTTTETTGFGNIKFMFAAKALRNKATGKEEYVVKLEFDGTVAENLALKERLSSINSKKIVTNNVSKAGNFIVSFSSTYAPTVVDAEGNKLEGKDIPFFDSRIDTGLASVLYTIVDYGTTQIIRLKGIALKDLELAKREERVNTEDVTLEKLKKLADQS